MTGGLVYVNRPDRNITYRMGPAFVEGVHWNVSKDGGSIFRTPLKSLGLDGVYGMVCDGGQSLFLVDRSLIVSLDTRSGKKNWREKHGLHLRDQIGFSYEIGSDGGRLILLDDLNFGCYDPKDGKVISRRESDLRG